MYLTDVKALSNDGLIAELMRWSYCIEVACTRYDAEKAKAMVRIIRYEMLKRMR